MGQLISDSVEQGREAYRQHAWREAFESLRIADSEAALSPEDLALLAESAWFAGDLDAAIQARERAHADYLRQGDQRHAAGLALQLAVDHFERLETAIGNGWLGRAKRLLDEARRMRCPWLAGSFAGLHRPPRDR